MEELRNILSDLNGDGSIDDTFNVGNGPNAPISPVSVQADGKIIVAGQFSSVNGVARQVMARLEL